MVPGSYSDSKKETTLMEVQQRQWRERNQLGRKEATFKLSPLSSLALSCPPGGLLGLSYPMAPFPWSITLSLEI